MSPQLNWIILQKQTKRTYTDQQKSLELIMIFIANVDFIT